MKWHYLKDNDYPHWYADIIVKCADGEVLKTGAWPNYISHIKKSWKYVSAYGKFWDIIEF